MQWLVDNKEWVFSGIGVALLAALVNFIFLKWNRSFLSQKQKSGKNSTNYQAGGDINVGKFDD
jgi:hypothetical protein